MLASCRFSLSLSLPTPSDSFTLFSFLSGLDEVLPPTSIPWPPLFRHVATRRLRQLCDCVIRLRRRRRVRSGGIRSILTTNKSRRSRRVNIINSKKWYPGNNRIIYEIIKPNCSLATKGIRLESSQFNNSELKQNKTKISRINVKNCSICFYKYNKYKCLGTKTISFPKIRSFRTESSSKLDVH